MIKRVITMFLLGAMLCVASCEETERDKMTSPAEWKEIEKLNDWYPVKYFVSREGDRVEPQMATREGFGWFAYRVFIDPGLEAADIERGNPGGVSERLHESFRELSQACMAGSDFGEGLRLLYEDVHLFERNRIGVIDYEVPSLTSEERNRLKSIAEMMQEVKDDEENSKTIRAAAELVVGLTGGDDFAEMAVSPEVLGRIPNRYPKQVHTAFLSQYYLFSALSQADMDEEAWEIVKAASDQYASAEVLRGLAAWSHVQELAEDPGPMAEEREGGGLDYEIVLLPIAAYPRPGVQSDLLPQLAKENQDERGQATRVAERVASIDPSMDDEEILRQLESSDARFDYRLLDENTLILSPGRSLKIESYQVARPLEDSLPIGLTLEICFTAYQPEKRNMARVAFESKMECETLRHRIEWDEQSETVATQSLSITDCDKVLCEPEEFRVDCTYILTVCSPNRESPGAMVLAKFVPKYYR